MKLNNNPVKVIIVLLIMGIICPSVIDKIIYIIKANTSEQLIKNAILVASYNPFKEGFFEYLKNIFIRYINL